MTLTPAFVEREYNNRAAIPDHPRWFARYAELSAAAVAALSPQRDLRYGPGPKETLDLFVPAGRARGTLAFIHGGYWRSLDKSDFSFVAVPFVAQGFAVANVNYDLCPDVSVAAIVDEIRGAIAWLVREGPARGPLMVSGHSAGGHLAAMTLATDWTTLGIAHDPIAGAVSVSGVHDLAPMPLFSYNVDLKLDAASACALSPVKMKPRSLAPLAIVCGAGETSEFRRQSQLLWDAWPQNRPRDMESPLFVAGRDHFSVIADYADPASELTRRTLALLA